MEERDGLKVMYQQTKEQLQLALEDQQRRTETCSDSEEQLRNRISDLEAQVSRLTLDNGEARRQAEASRYTSQQLATESTELAKTLSQLRQSRSDAQKDADTRALQIDNLEAKISSQNMELERVRQAGKAKQTELDQMRSLFTQLDATRAELVDTLQRDRARIEHANRELQALRIETERLHAENLEQRQAHDMGTVSIAKLDAERDAMTHELDAKTEELANMRASYEESAARQLRAEKVVSEMEAQMQIQTSQLNRQETELSALRQGAQSFENDHQALQQELQLKTEEITALSNDLANMTRENQVVNSELMDAASERDSCRETLAALEMRLGHADSLVATKEVEREDIMSSYKKLHDTNVQLSVALREAEDNLSRVRAEQNAMQAEVTAVRQQQLDMESRFQRQDIDAHQFRQQSDDYTRYAREMQEQLDQSHAAQQALEKDLAEAVAVKAASEMLVADLHRQIANTEAHKNVTVADKDRAERNQSELQIQLQLQTTRADELEQLLSTMRSQMADQAGAPKEVSDADRLLSDSSISRKMSAKLEAAQSNERHLAEELRKAHVKISELESRSRSDEAYKMQTMQYLRKYEAELQRKEQRVVELEHAAAH
eukprot:SAG31_NODE_1562_length_7871_cov_8.208312_3_plen_608_part_00